MKKIIISIVGLCLCAGIALGYSTQSEVFTGTVTSGALTVINPTSTSVIDILLVNRSLVTDEAIYLKAEGDSTLTGITTEGFPVHAGESITLENFRTPRIQLLATSGDSITYKMLVTSQN